MLKAAFLFVAGGANGKINRSEVETPSVCVTTIGVANYEEAIEVSKELYEKGYGAIELCGGFGHKGTAMVVEALEGKIPVGVVRFDIHPGLDNKSGDLIF